MMQRHHNSRGRGEKEGLSSRGGCPRRRSTDDEMPPRLSHQQQPPPPPPPRMYRSRSCGSGRTQQQPRGRDLKSPRGAAASEYYVEAFRHLSTFDKDSESPRVADHENDIHESVANTRSHEGFKQLPFRSSTWVGSKVSSSPRHYKKSYSSDSTPQPPQPPPLPTSSRSSQHAVNSSHLPRRNVYSKGINVHNIQSPPPPRQMLHAAQNPQATVSRIASASTPSLTSDRSVEDAAVSRLRQLCMDIIQSAKEGTSPPQRAEIKEVVVEYHRSRRQAISPRDPNFAEIPSEYSEVLTYGLARAQNVQQSTTAEESEETAAKAKAGASRSRFAEIKVKDERDYPEDSRLPSTVVLGPNDDVMSCVSLPSTVEHS